MFIINTNIFCQPLIIPGFIEPNGLVPEYIIKPIEAAALKKKNSFEVASLGFEYPTIVPTSKKAKPIIQKIKKL